jgi:energy-coupling factor transporter ATP-binding protein EcfA2
MILADAQVTYYKSIDDSGGVSIEPKVTVLVGQNEAGKTGFLQALYKSHPIFTEDEGFDKIEEYPRKHLGRFDELHPDGSAVATALTYTLLSSDTEAVNKALGATVLREGKITITAEYEGPGTVEGLQELVDQKTYIEQLLIGVTLPEQLAATARAASTVKELIEILTGQELATEAAALLQRLNSQFSKSDWANVLAELVWSSYLKPRVPRFFYFDDYRLLPGKANLQALLTRVQQAKASPKGGILSQEDQAVLALLQMARVDLTELTKELGYESARAKLEGVSNIITDQVFKYWRQNKNLEVVIDIKADAADIAPYNSGPNLYIRIRNQRHRVTVPFSQRSKGFIWFFSFLVWFDSVRSRAVESGGVASSLVLLLDEPGLSLHALAQEDLLEYVDDLAKEHQVIYTTHSPFMVRSERLQQVRVVEDKETGGTKVSDKLDASDPKTLFPLQAALGYTVAQNLFISTRNLLVEGIADLVYLQFFSQQCEMNDKEALREDVTIVPAGGLEKIATFVALLGANALEIVVLHDYAGAPDARLKSLVQEKIMRDKQLLSYAAFRDATSKKVVGKKPADKAAENPFLPTDVEDLFSIPLYLALFNDTFQEHLAGQLATEAELPAGTRIIDRLNRWLVSKNISLRPTPGFNHYAPANHLISHEREIDADTLTRFAALFRTVNSRFSDSESED